MTPTATPSRTSRAPQTIVIQSAETIVVVIVIVVDTTTTRRNRRRLSLSLSLSLSLCCDDKKVRFQNTRGIFSPHKKKGVARKKKEKIATTATMSASPSSNGDGDGDDTHNVKMGASAAERNAPHIAGKNHCRGYCASNRSVKKKKKKKEEKEKSTTRSR